jgi:hypothetical protein
MVKKPAKNKIERRTMSVTFLIRPSLRPKLEARISQEAPSLGQVISQILEAAVAKD